MEIPAYQKVNDQLPWFYFPISKEQNKQFFPVIARFTFFGLFVCFMRLVLSAALCQALQGGNKYFFAAFQYLLLNIYVHWLMCDGRWGR